MNGSNVLSDIRACYEVRWPQFNDLMGQQRSWIDGIARDRGLLVEEEKKQLAEEPEKEETYEKLYEKLQVQRKTEKEERQKSAEERRRILAQRKQIAKEAAEAGEHKYILSMQKQAAAEAAEIAANMNKKRDDKIEERLESRGDELDRNVKDIDEFLKDFEDMLEKYSVAPEYITSPVKQQQKQEEEVAQSPSFQLPPSPTMPSSPSTPSTTPLPPLPSPMHTYKQSPLGDFMATPLVRVTSAARSSPMQSSSSSSNVKPPRLSSFSPLTSPQLPLSPPRPSPPSNRVKITRPPSCAPPSPMSPNTPVGIVQHHRHHHQLHSPLRNASSTKRNNPPVPAPVSVVEMSREARLERQRLNRQKKIEEREAKKEDVRRRRIKLEKEREARLKKLAEKDNVERQNRKKGANMTTTTTTTTTNAPNKKKGEKERKVQNFKKINDLHPNIHSSHHSHPSLYSESQNYEMTPLFDRNSDTDTDEGYRLNKPVPAWARTPRLREVAAASQNGRAVSGGARVDPDGLFPPDRNPDMHELLSSLGSHSNENMNENGHQQGGGGKKHRKIRSNLSPPNEGKRKKAKRGSSANWINDKITWKEEIDYKRDMGWLDAPRRPAKV